MTTKSLNRLLSFAAQEKAEKLVIDGQKHELACLCYLPLGEEAHFRLPKSLEEDLSSSLRRLLKLAPDEITSGKYFKIRSRDCHLDFHLSIMPGKTGEKIIIDIVRKQTRDLSIGRLGLQPEDKKNLQKVLAAPSGLVIISSPERQGRSTTLAACLREIDKDKRSVYFLTKNSDIKIDGVVCLGDSPEIWDKVTKHDSNVIAADDCTDETLSSAILAAATGRLILLTIEADTPWEVLYKLFSLGLPSTLIATNLKLISQQRLVDLKRSPHAKRSTARLRKEVNPDYLRHRIGVFETLVFTPTMRDFIKAQTGNYQQTEFWSKLLKLAVANGYKTWQTDNTKKKHEGLI